MWQIKLSRNSNETYFETDESKERYVKIREAKLANKKRFPIQKIRLKGKVYQQASCLIEYGDIIIFDKVYTVVRVTLNDNFGEKNIQRTAANVNKSPD